MYTIGIDLGGTNIAVGICNEDLEIIDKASVPTLSKRPIEQIVADMAALCKKLAERNSISMDKIDRIGIAVPGTINSARGIVEYSNNIAEPTVLRLLAQVVALARSRDCCKAGSSMAARIAIMAITTRSSISVNAD